MVFRNPVLLAKYVANNFGLLKNRYLKRIKGFRHHLCHAVTAYHFAPFNQERAVVFILDGMGENEYASLWEFEGKDYREISSTKTEALNTQSRHNLASIGIIYTLYTEVLGFEKIADEGKTEALAAYGKYDETLY